MSSARPLPSGDLITYLVKVNGSAITDETRILSIEIESAISRIPLARIKIADGAPGQDAFGVSSSSSFVPGAEITIEAGYNSENELIFGGIITSQSIGVNPATGAVLTVECRDAVIKTCVGRKSATFSDQRDSDIISGILANYAGLSADIDSTSTVWPEQVQYYATDWDFMLSRAEANGLIVSVENGKIRAKKPDADTSSVLRVEYGNNLLGFHADLNAITQLGQVQASSWDFKNQSLIHAEASNDHPGPGNISSRKLSEVVGLSNFQLQSAGHLNQAELADWAKAQMLKSEYAKIRGSVKLQGSSLVTPGKYITLGGLGDRFNGDHLVSGVHHHLADGNWMTEVSLGLSPIWFTQEPDVMAPPASGLLPGVRGLYHATVKKIFEDPDDQYRILVNIPLFDPNGEGLWARLSNFYSTSGAGAFFLPEVGDEVVLGFLNEDPRYPVILGSLYSKTTRQPYHSLEPNENNSVKAIVSKSGINIQFDDESKTLSFITPAGNKAILNDTEKQVTIQDENENKILLGENGITIKSASNIIVEAEKNLVLKGNTGVSIEAPSGDVEIKAINIKENAEAEYSAEGSASASVQAGGGLTLKGAIVHIN